MVESVSNRPLQKHGEVEEELASAKHKEPLRGLKPRDITIPFKKGYEIPGRMASKGDLDLTAVSALWATIRVIPEG